MKRWIVWAMLACLVGGAAWIHQQSKATEKRARLSAAWLDSGWAYAKGLRSTSWNRRIHLMNSSDKELTGTVYAFAGEKPSNDFIEQSARSAGDGIDLGPGESVATGVWSSDDPAKGVQVLAFFCSAEDLKRRLELRQRYPLVKVLWPLPYEILQVGEYTPARVLRTAD